LRSLAQLIELERSLRGVRVLSVYLDGTVTDLAKQRTWRLHLAHCLDDLRKWIAGSSHAEREEFEHCVRLLDEQLLGFTQNIGAPGWAGFITADGVREASLIPVPMPTQAVWSTGMNVAPYMRALKETRPVAIALVDSARADVYRYCLGELEPVESIRAHHTVMQPSHMGNAPRPGFHRGTSGSAGRDQAQRSLLEGTNRMLAEAVEVLLRVVGRDGWIVTGGIPQVSGHLVERLSARAAGRVTGVESLDIHSSAAEVAEAARAAASTLRNAADAAQVAEIADRGEANDLGALGPAATRQALDESRVRELYVTHRFLTDHGADATNAVRDAIDQGATVEEVSGGAAEQLDAHGGMAARFRYRIAHAPTHS